MSSNGGKRARVRAATRAIASRLRRSVSSRWRDRSPEPSKTWSTRRTGLVDPFWGYSIACRGLRDAPELGTGLAAQCWAGRDKPLNLSVFAIRGEWTDALACAASRTSELTRETGFTPAETHRDGPHAFVFGGRSAELPIRVAYAWAVRGTQALEVHISCPAMLIAEPVFEERVRRIVGAFHLLYSRPLGQPEVRVLAAEHGLDLFDPSLYVEVATRLWNEGEGLDLPAELWRAALALDRLNDSAVPEGIAAALDGERWEGSLAADGRALDAFQRWHSWHGIALACATAGATDEALPYFEESTDFARRQTAADPTWSAALRAALYDVANARFWTDDSESAAEALRELAGTAPDPSAELTAIRERIAADQDFADYLATPEARTLFAGLPPQTPPE